eukprot:1361782-Prymnesium_polylepis.1
MLLRSLGSEPEQSLSSAACAALPPPPPPPPPPICRRSSAGGRPHGDRSAMGGNCDGVPDGARVGMQPLPGDGGWPVVGPPSRLELESPRPDERKMKEGRRKESMSPMEPRRTLHCCNVPGGEEGAAREGRGA